MTDPLLWTSAPDPPTTPLLTHLRRHAAFWSGALGAVAGAATAGLAHAPWLGTAIAVAVVSAAFFGRRRTGWGVAGIVTLCAVGALAFATSPAQVLHTGQPWTGASPTYSCGSVLSATSAVRHQWLVAGGSKLFLHCKEAVSSNRIDATAVLVLGAILLAAGGLSTLTRGGRLARRRRHVGVP